MSLFYSIVNIIVPLIALSHRTIVRSQAQNPIEYGKWALLLVLIFLFDLFAFFFQDSWFYMLIDLVCKIALVYFLPVAVNDAIENVICKLHLEIKLDELRYKVINKLFAVYRLGSGYLISKLRQNERQELKKAMISYFSEDNTKTDLVIKSQKKKYDSIGVDCNLVEKAIKQSSKSKRVDTEPIKQSAKPQKQSKKQMPEIAQSNRLAESSRPTVFRRNQQPQSFNHNQRNKVEVPKMVKSLVRGRDELSFARTLNQSNTLLEQVDQQRKMTKRRPQSTVVYDARELKRDSKIPDFQSPYQQQIKQFKSSKLLPTQKGITKQSPPTLQYSKQPYHMQIKRTSSVRPERLTYREEEPEKILKKLDLSVSEYSDMFEDEQQLFDTGVNLVHKVESILQINGSEGSSHLEIYYLELYSNDELRIMTPSNRQFERHQLLSIRKIPDGYYEFNLAGGCVNRRKIKFRGIELPFLKYLI